jgi:hypothetical protein
MANRYGEAAILAARQGASGGINPEAQWESAMEKLYPTSPTARRKGGPRGAFLGLCEEGLVKGIPAGHYSATRDHKNYAVRAVALLTDATQSLSVSALWRAVTQDPEKPHGGQMDIVMALWKNDLIVRKS